MLHFDSDYMEGAHPELIRRLAETNLEQTPGYGLDEYCHRAERLILDACGLTNGKVHFLVGGTQTNSTVIDTLLAHHEGVLAAETAHICSHEAGAIEVWGHKVLTLPQHDGKISAEDVRKYVADYYSDEMYEHVVAPGMVYISHPTELGTLYTLDELTALSKICREADLPLYMDGARLGYALASGASDVTLPDVARLCDVFYIGGTKVGALFGEAVVTSRPELLPHFFSIVKQHGALLAKGRLLGVQFETLFTDNLYVDISRNACLMAAKIRKAFIDHGYRLFIDSPTNQQFFVLTPAQREALGQDFAFESWGELDDGRTAVRFCTSWATRDEDVQALVGAIAAL